MKRLISMLLILCLTLTFSASAETITYTEVIDVIVESYEAGKLSSSESSDRFSNALKRSTELLILIAMELDADNNWSEQIGTVSDDYFKNTENAAGKFDLEIMNCVHRLLEILMIIAYDMDTNNVYQSEIKSIGETFLANNEAADNVIIKAIDGFYRCGDMLAVIARLVTGDNERVTDLMSGRVSQNLYAEDTNDQFFSSLEAMMYMTALIAMEYDFTAAEPVVLAILDDEGGSSNPLENCANFMVELLAVIAYAND